MFEIVDHHVHENFGRSVLALQLSDLFSHSLDTCVGLRSLSGSPKIVAHKCIERTRPLSLGLTFQEIHSVQMDIPAAASFPLQRDLFSHLNLLSITVRFRGLVTIQATMCVLRGSLNRRDVRQILSKQI